MESSSMKGTTAFIAGHEVVLMCRNISRKISLCDVKPVMHRLCADGAAS